LRRVFRFDKNFFHLAQFCWRLFFAIADAVETHDPFRAGPKRPRRAAREADADATPAAVKKRQSETLINLLLQKGLL
jgi:hypothetical protein